MFTQNRKIEMMALHRAEDPDLADPGIAPCNLLDNDFRAIGGKDPDCLSCGESYHQL